MRPLKANRIWHKKESSSSSSKCLIRGSSHRICAFPRGTSGRTFRSFNQSHYRIAVARPRDAPSSPSSTRLRSSPKIADSKGQCSRVWCRARAPSTSSSRRMTIRALATPSTRTTPSWKAIIARASIWVRSRHYRTVLTTLPSPTTLTRETSGCTHRRCTHTNHLKKWTSSTLIVRPSTSHSTTNL